MIGAIILAAGSGTRFGLPGQSLPKQYQQLGNSPVYMWSLSAFCRHSEIDSVLLVVAADMQAGAEEYIAKCELDGRQKVSVIVGGATRQESVHRGLEHFAGAACHPSHILIHDAARPFVTDGLIDKTIRSVTDRGACSLATPITDTLKRVREDVIEETLDRASLYLMQTPQAGRFDWLLDAHRRAVSESFETTDDAAILEYAGHKVSIVSGSRFNLKITTAEDMVLSQAIAQIILAEQSAGR